MSLPHVIVYCTPTCPYCQRALALLDSKQVAYELINVDDAPHKRAQMRELAKGRNSVPQIFIGDTHVGGCDELMALHESGNLDELLAGE